MVKTKHKIIVASAMHGRHDTVRYCLEKLKDITVHMVYSSDKDGEFLKQFPNVIRTKHENLPLARKWNSVIRSLANYPFDAVILLGSDDYVDDNFLRFIDENIRKYDLIAFSDMYFEQGKQRYYWGGYGGSRAGEPAGAGKTYTKKFLQKVNFDLFGDTVNRGLDGYSWRLCKRNNAKILVTSLKENNLYCADIKDGLGITQLTSIKGIIQL